jgi:DNA-binding IclR family transcriptional regulator
MNFSMNKNNEPEDKKGGIQAVGVASEILSALCEHSGAMQLKEVAETTGLSAPKVHRYLSSLIHSGLAEQDHRTGLYSLGPMATRLGLAAIGQNNVVMRASTLLKDLCIDLQTSGHLAIWGERGPVLIRNEHGGPPIISTMGLGATMPLLRSATGRVYLSHLSRNATKKLLQPEMKILKVKMEEVDAIIERTQKRGYGRIFEGLIPGLFAVSFPLFGIDGNIQCCITIISTDREFFAENGEPISLVQHRVQNLNKINMAT